MHQQRLASGATAQNALNVAEIGGDRSFIGGGDWHMETFRQSVAAYGDVPGNLVDHHFHRSLGSIWGGDHCAGGGSPKSE